MYKQRVVEERDELYKKLIRLGSFFHTSKYEEVPYEEKKRLRLQHALMIAYHRVLEERIAAFPIQFIEGEVNHV